ncbi:type II toxin-antitoxin system RelE/ParE family toxin [Beijerinckiaceae bacterium]|nr:type II toxin-antitoxin system RelE/ParE family toxin [Beijerinckiaceae bacterium]
MKVIVRDEVYGDLDRIHAWIAKDRPAIADSVIDRILDSAEYLGWFPNMGHRGRVPGTHEWIVKGLPFIIVYEVYGERNELIITAIFHGAQDR